MCLLVDLLGYTLGAVAFQTRMSRSDCLQSGELTMMQIDIEYNDVGVAMLIEGWWR